MSRAWHRPWPKRPVGWVARARAYATCVLRSRVRCLAPDVARLERGVVLVEVLALFGVGDCIARRAGLRLPLLGLAVPGQRVRAGQRLVGVREIPVTDPVRLAVFETPPRVPDRRLRAPEHRVDARHLPLAAREVLGAALLGLAPVIARRVRDVE